MTSVQSVAHAPAKAHGATPEGGDAAAGDLFAALVAAVLPQIQGITQGTKNGSTGTGAGDAAVTGGAGGAGVAGGEGVALDLTALAGDGTAATDPSTAAPAEGEAGTAQGILNALAGAAAKTPAAPVLDGLALRHGATTEKAPTAAPDQTAGTPADATPVIPNPLAAAAGSGAMASDTTTANEGDSDSDSAKASAAGPVAATGRDATTRKAAPATGAVPADRAADPAPQPFAVTHRQAVQAAEGTSEATPVRAAEPHQQLASVITPLSQRPDGTYHLALRLHPEHLGAVDVDVQLHQGTIEVHVQTHQAEARELLTSHLDDLRRELEQAGLRAGTLDVSDRQQPRQSMPGQGQANGHGFRSPVNPTPDTDGPVTPTTTDRHARTAAADGAVDVQL